MATLSVEEKLERTVTVVTVVVVYLTATFLQLFYVETVRKLACDHIRTVTCILKCNKLFVNFLGQEKQPVILVKIFCIQRSSA